jgi:glycosyltransferase involved in cell wall biosynthesis
VVESRANGGIRRVAFLTPEYPTEKGPGGGVGNYVAKMSAALAAHGVVAEVFVSSAQPSGVIEAKGIRVERVPPARSLLLRGIARLLRTVAGSRGDVLNHLVSARNLAAALQRRHLERPFDVVQSSNLHLTGAFVPRLPNRRHIVRISTSRRLFDAASGAGHALMSRWVEDLDARIMRRADLTYAPSRLLAEYFRAHYGFDVQVVRPPAELGAEPATELPFAVPDRYLIHFGTLGPRKGTDLVAKALVRAWQVEPSLRLVWVGRLREDALASYRDAWGTRADQVTYLGTLPKELTYGVLHRAAASVLPSTVDNLPNTVIESLILGVPVIGSDGASIDELVEHGVSGALVPIGDVPALAEAMIEAWQGRAPWLGAGFRMPAALQEMRPERAVRQFLDAVERATTQTR